MPTQIDPALFREAMGHYPTGVAVVTATMHDGAPTGMVVGTFSLVSLDPPLIAFFPTSSSRSFAQLRTAQTFCVNVMAADQEPLCRRFATSGTDKFDGVRWRPGPFGSPILEDAVCWVECTYEQVTEAGDHHVVLGRVHEFEVQRATLPLLFFQGGYGRFSPGSFIAAPEPELIQAAQLAETIRSEVEDLAVRFGVTCSVLAKIRWDAVQVLAANDGASAEPTPLGHRQPIVPPLGAVFLIDGSDAEVDGWLQRATDRSPERRGRDRALLETVRASGYSVLAAEPDTLQRHRAALSAFELSEQLPGQERAVRRLTAELTDLYCPDLLPGERYDLASIVVPLPSPAGAPPMALRMTGVPAGLSTEQIESFIDGLEGVAAGTGVVTAASRVAGAR